MYILFMHNKLLSNWFSIIMMTIAQMLIYCILINLEDAHLLNKSWTPYKNISKIQSVYCNYHDYHVQFPIKLITTRISRFIGSNGPQIKAVYLRQLSMGPISYSDPSSWSNLHKCRRKWRNNSIIMRVCDSGRGLKRKLILSKVLKKDVFVIFSHFGVKKVEAPRSFESK